MTDPGAGLSPVPGPSRYPSAMHPTYRVAVRVDGDPVPSHVAAAIEALAAERAVELVALVLTDGPATRPARAASLYDAAERKVFRGSLPALVARPLPAAAASLPTARTDRETDDLLRDHAVDVVVDLASAARRGHAEAVRAPLGTWSMWYAAGLNGVRDRVVPRRAARDGLGVAFLEAHLPDGRVIEIGRHVSALPVTPFVRSRDALLWASANLPARALASPALDARLRAAAVIAPATARVPASSPRGRSPGWARLATTTARRVAERVWFRETWEVLTRRARDGAVPRDLSGFVRVPPPEGRFYADPFVFAQPSGTRLFVEMSPVGRHEGSIAALDAKAEGTWGPPLPVLDVGRHVAFPHVTTVRGAPLLIPDDAIGGVVAYRPAGDTRSSGWHPEATLLTGVRASDPTLLEHEGRLWLFVTQTSQGMAPWDELHLYSATSLEGPWVPHPANPVVADVRRARSAGRFLRFGGRLIRPAQDCSTSYGRRIILNEVVRLDVDVYEERWSGTVEPVGFPGATRTHTYTVDGGIEAVDAFVRAARVHLLARKVLRHDRGAPTAASSRRAGSAGR